MVSKAFPVPRELQDPLVHQDHREILVHQDQVA